MAEQIALKNTYMVGEETEEQLSPAQKKMLALRSIVDEHELCVRELDYGDYGAQRLYRRLYDLHRVYQEVELEDTAPLEPVDQIAVNALRAWRDSQNPVKYNRRWDILSREAVSLRQSLADLEQPPFPGEMPRDEE